MFICIFAYIYTNLLIHIIYVHILSRICPTVPLRLPRPLQAPPPQRAQVFALLPGLLRRELADALARIRCLSGRLIGSEELPVPPGRTNDENKCCFRCLKRIRPF